MFELPQDYYPPGAIDDTFLDDDNDVDDEDDNAQQAGGDNSLTASNNVLSVTEQKTDKPKQQADERQQRKENNAEKKRIQELLDEKLNQRIAELKDQSNHLDKEEARAIDMFKDELDSILCNVTDLDTQVKRMQLNLEFLKGVDWDSQVIVLPDICVTEYSDERFTFNEITNTIRMVTRNKYLNTFFNEISENLDEPSYCIYFYGCRGVGKSFLIYQLACRLMCEDNNVVVYVPQCFEDIVFRTLKTLYVVCKSYDISSVNEVLDDKEEHDLRNIIEKERNDGYNSNFVLRIISSVKKALLAVKKRLILVIDQTNLIMRKEILYENQIEFVRKLQEKQHAILSGSANNEVPRMNINSNFIKDVHPIFDEEEFLSFLVVKSMFNKIEQNRQKFKDNPSTKTRINILDEGIVKEIIHLTGGIPFEITKFVDLVNNQSGLFSPFSKWSSEYQKKFRSDNDQAVLKEWYNKHDDEDKKKILENMLKCFMGREITDQNDKYYDKRFVVLRKDQPKTDGSTADFLKPFSPCARTLLFSIYAGLLVNTQILKDFLNVANSTIGDHVTVQGILLEQNVINLMRLKVLKTFEIVSINNLGFVAATNKLKLENFHDVEFAGYSAPPNPPTKNTLYIPLSKQYPAFDYVYYDYSKQAAYFVNVTKQQDAFNHIASNDRKAKAKKRVTISIKDWKESFLPPNVKFYDVYLVLKKNFQINPNRKNWRQCNVIYVEDLKQDNPVAYLSDHRYK